MLPVSAKLIKISMAANSHFEITLQSSIRVISVNIVSFIISTKCFEKSFLIFEKDFF